MMVLRLRRFGIRLDTVEGHLGDDRDRLSPAIDIELMPHGGRVSPWWNPSGRSCHDRTSPVTTAHQVVPVGSVRLAGRERRGGGRAEATDPFGAVAPRGEESDAGPGEPRGGHRGRFEPLRALLPRWRQSSSWQSPHGCHRAGARSGRDRRRGGCGRPHIVGHAEDEAGE